MRSFRHLFVLATLALSGCQSPGDPQQLFYEDALTTEAWFVLEAHPDLRELAKVGDLRGPCWKAFNELLVSISSDKTRQDALRASALQRALAREQQ